MAGAGYKLFNTGDVLTAAQVNTYLMEQTVMVFADATARTTALSGVVAEGMLSYLKSTKQVEVYNGSAWVASDDPNAIQNTIVDAKGDLIAASAADTPARLAVGNNGDTLVADSSTTTGLRYNPPVGSLANPVINGGADIWQRGTSFASGSYQYTADRWGLLRGGFAAGATVSRQTTSDTTNLPNIQYAIRVQRDSGNTSTAVIQLDQQFETVNSIPFAGKTITFSFYARRGANYSASSNALYAEVVTGTGTDQRLATGYTGGANAGSSTVTLTTSWQRFAFTANIAATTTEIAFYFLATPTGTAGANDWFEVTGVQMDVGTWTASTAPTFRRSGGTLAGELAACQRYYWRATLLLDRLFGFSTVNYSTTAAICSMPAKVTMRAAPSSVDYANVFIYDGVTNYAITGLAIWGATNEQTLGLLATGATGMTQYRPGFLTAAATNGYIGFNAEL